VADERDAGRAFEALLREKLAESRRGLRLEDLADRGEEAPRERTDEEGGRE
jgi:hypothetical protein